MKGARKQKPPKELIECLALENGDWKPSYPFNTRVVRDAVEKSLFHGQRGLCVCIAVDDWICLTQENHFTLNISGHNMVRTKDQT